MLPIPIDIIIPVYLGLPQTRRCIESVLASSVARPFTPVVVDDASPDSELRNWLHSLADAKRITLLANPTNIGFVRTVNRAMELHPERDAVLLNSDCEVSGNWLDRLASCVDSDPSIGTATPFSNNATICSYPFLIGTTDLPQGWSLQELDDIFACVNAGLNLQIPTAVGSCMYIRRACWNALDGFDAVAFGAGYGEECDFSMRAQLQGWKNVLCADVFVYHEGAVSFGAQRLERTTKAEQLIVSRYPDYADLVTDFVRKDPALVFRHAVSKKRSERSMADAMRVIDEYIGALQNEMRLHDQDVVLLRKNILDLEDAQAQAERLLKQSMDESNRVTAALSRAEQFVLERETDITKVTAERDLMINERERLTGAHHELYHRFNRTLEQRVLRQITKLLRVLKLR